MKIIIYGGKPIYMWIDDYIDNKKEIEEQLSYELKRQRTKTFKIILTYTEENVWEMGDKWLSVKLVSIM